MSLVVVGASSVALNVLDIVAASGRSIASFVDDTCGGESSREWLGVPLLSSIEKALSHVAAPEVVIAIGDNYERGQIARRILEAQRDVRFATLIHPAASISPNAMISPGSIVMAGCRIAARADIRGFAYLNANTVVAHDCEIGESVSMSAGAVLGGGCVVGDRTILGLGATVREGSKIGRDVVVGAGSFVNDDVPESVVVVGTPARVLRRRSRGEPYLR